MIGWKIKTEQESIEKEASRYRDMLVQDKWDCFRDIMNYLEVVRKSTGIQFFDDNRDLGGLWTQFTKSLPDNVRK